MRWDFAGGEPRQFTHVNQAALAQRKLGEYEQFTFAGWNDETSFGYVVKPPDFKRDQKYPRGLPGARRAAGQLRELLELALERADFCRRRLRRRHESIFHGSTGYGQAFTDSISGDWGGKAARGSEARPCGGRSSSIPGLDGDHVCALGGSYGGYNVNWIAGRWPDRFKCLVSHDGIFDNRTMYYSTEELWFPEWEYGGPSTAIAKPMPSTIPSTT